MSGSKDMDSMEVEMNGSIIALDVGTTQIKSALFDRDGRVLEMKKCATPLRVSGERACYHPGEIWEIVRGQIECLTKRSKEKPTGISITGMAEAGLIVDRKSKRELTDILPWFERCTCSLAEHMTEEEADRVFQSTGLRNSFKYGIYKYLWLLKEEKLNRTKTVWLSMCDYIAFKLTGNLTTDPTFAARTYVYDVLGGRWDEERIQGYGLGVENFPDVVGSGDTIGNYQGIPVGIAGHDHICAAFGLLYGRRDGICDSAGTSETYVGILRESVIEQGFPKDSGLIYGPFVDGGYFYMANVPSSGHSVEWFRRKLQMEELSYEEMNRKLEKLGKEPSGLLYFPYLTGMGAPWYLPEMTGVLIGLQERHDGAMVLKGILEGIQFQARWLLNLVENFHEIHGDSLVCAGGSVHNHTLMQIKADSLNRNVQVPEVTEATLCGAAALFLKKNQGKEAAEHFLKRSVQTRKKYLADRENAKRYERIFEEQYLPLAEMMGKIKGIFR